MVKMMVTLKQRGSSSNSSRYLSIAEGREDFISSGYLITVENFCPIHSTVNDYLDNTHDMLKEMDYKIAGVLVPLELVTNSWYR